VYRATSSRAESVARAKSDPKDVRHIRGEELSNGRGIEYPRHVGQQFRIGSLGLDGHRTFPYDNQQDSPGLRD